MNNSSCLELSLAQIRWSMNVHEITEKVERREINMIDIFFQPIEVLFSLLHYDIFISTFNALVSPFNYQGS